MYHVGSGSHREMRHYVHTERDETRIESIHQTSVCAALSSRLRLHRLPHASRHVRSPPPAAPATAAPRGTRRPPGAPIRGRVAEGSWKRHGELMAHRMQTLDGRLGMQQEEVQWFPWLGTPRRRRALARSARSARATAVRPRRATTARRAARARGRCGCAAAHAPDAGQGTLSRTHARSRRCCESLISRASQGLIAAVGHPSPGPLKA